MVHIVIGTRAQFLKMAPVMRELDARGLAWRWIYTAQHKDTMTQLIADFSVKHPDYVVFDWETEAKTMKKMMIWLIKIMFSLLKEKTTILDGFTGPTHIVLTHGDTITAWWGALLGKLSGCQVMHVESGLRSFKLFDPFPEELNRLITFWLSDIYACPGEWAVGNLKRFNGEKINTIHNTQIETLNYGLAHSADREMDFSGGTYSVVSIHRYENIFDKKQLKTILSLIERIAENIHVIFVLHPATEKRLEALNYAGRTADNPNITFVKRLSHLSFISLIKRAEFVVTDGGGNQEELFHMGKPCLIFRSCSERQEGIGHNAVLSRFDQRIIDKFVSTYETYNKERVHIKERPSAIVVDYLLEKGFTS